MASPEVEDEHCAVLPLSASNSDVTASDSSSEGFVCLFRRRFPGIAKMMLAALLFALALLFCWLLTFALTPLRLLLLLFTLLLTLTTLFTNRTITNVLLDTMPFKKYKIKCLY